MAKSATAASEQPVKQSGGHRATYATDKKQGGYLIRVEGPTPNLFAGRTVPVTRRDNSQSNEKLSRLIWTGTDQDTGTPVSLYKFEPKPRDSELDDEIPF